MDGNRGEVLRLTELVRPETMAEYIEKPLFSISLGQLSDEEKIDEHLEGIFEHSVKLQGVLLLDEADVVLEARSYENLKRNALVSGKIRGPPLLSTN